jgi:hypothetical protein
VRSNHDLQPAERWRTLYAAAEPQTLDLTPDESPVRKTRGRMRWKRSG